MNGMKRLGSIRWLAVVLLVSSSAAPALADGPFQYFPLTPCRVADTRNPPGINAGPAVPGIPPNYSSLPSRSFQVKGNCGVLGTAKAVTVNITVTQPTSGGWLGIYPGATGFSGTSTINFNTGEFAIANGAIVPLAPTGTGVNDITVQWGANDAGATAHVILDVTGYFQ